MPSDPGSSLAELCLIQHVCLIFIFNTSLSKSWDEIIITYKRIYSHYKDRALPFLMIIITTISKGKGEDKAAILHIEAKALIT
jgi:polynucleotide 5'-kinase involved in rRNA processing